MDDNTDEVKKEKGNESGQAGGTGEACTFQAKKPLDNTNIEEAKTKTSDLKVFGNGDLFQLIGKASSKEQGWMKSTKAMVTGNGCVVQVTTEFRNKDGEVIACAEALTFVPNVAVALDNDGNKRLKSL